MKINRMNNLIRNTVFTGILTVYRTLAPFFLRTALLYVLGVQYLGLNSLFASVVQVLNLTELGVESAIAFSFYRPIAEDDHATICGLLRLYKKYYITIGLSIAAIGLVLLPFVPRLIQGEIPLELNLYVLYLLYLTATVMSYLVAGYKRCLLRAHMRSDIISKVTFIVTLTINAFQLVAICWFHSYYLYLMVSICEGISVNLISAKYTNSMYPTYKPVGKLDVGHRQQIRRRIKALFTVKVSDIILNSVDAAMVSACFGLTALAVYQNYYFILFAVIKLVQVLFDSALAGIGNSLVVESKDKNYRDFEMMTFAVFWVTGWCACCLLCLYQPFMELWVGKDLLLSFKMVILFVCYFVAMELIRIMNVYKDAAGIWHKDRFRPLTAALVNLTLNVATIQHMGLYGVLLSSIAALLLIDTPWLMHNIFSQLFPQKQLWVYARTLAGYVIVTAMACTVNVTVCRLIPLGGWIGLFAATVPCLVVPNLFFWIAYHNKTEFRQWSAILRSLWSSYKKTERK